jgi:A/G-specific adenine glycosylase
LRADLFLYETDKRPELPDGYIWISEGDMERYAIPRLVERLLIKLEAI